MSSIIPKPKQRTDFVVKKGGKAIYRGNSAFEAKQVAKSRSNTTVTFKTTSAFERFISQ